MQETTKEKLKLSQDKDLFKQALNEVLDFHCDARNGWADTESRKFLADVILNDIIKHMELKKPHTNNEVPFTGE